MQRFAAVLCWVLYNAYAFVPLASCGAQCDGCMSLHAVVRCFVHCSAARCGAFICSRHDSMLTIDLVKTLYGDESS